MISIMKEADVPAAAKRVQKLQQGVGTLGEFESAYPFLFHKLGAASDHVTDVQLRHFAVGEIRRFVALRVQFCLNFMCVLAALDGHADEYLGAIALAQAVVEFRDNPFT